MLAVGSGALAAAGAMIALISCMRDAFSRFCL